MSAAKKGQAGAFEATAKGHALPFTVSGYVHTESKLASGIKDADGMWVAKMHPLNATADDLKRSEKLAHLFCAAPDLLAALEAARNLYLQPVQPRELRNRIDSRVRAAIAKAEGK